MALLFCGINIYWMFLTLYGVSGEYKCELYNQHLSNVEAGDSFLPPELIDFWDDSAASLTNEEIEDIGKFVDASDVH